MGRRKKDGTGGGGIEPDPRLGRRLRSLRLARGLSLADLSGRVGISIGALSQIERGLSPLRVRVAWPLAAALSIDPSELSGEHDENERSDLYSVRQRDRKTLPVNAEGIRKELLSPAGAKVTGLLVQVDPEADSGAYSHVGHEFGIVLAGEVEVIVDGVEYRLATGDSFAFPSHLVHQFRNRGSVRADILWVNTNKTPETGDDS